MSKEELILMIKSNENTIANKEQKIQSNKQEIQHYQYRLAELKRQLFSQKREQFISNNDDKQLTRKIHKKRTKLGVNLLSLRC